MRRTRGRDDAGEHRVQAPPRPQRSRLNRIARLCDLPAIDTPRLVVRPLASADVAALAALTDDPSITEMVDFLPTPFTRADAGALIARNGDAECFLGAFHDDALIGVVGTHAPPDASIEIGYWIGPAFQRRGFAKEAVAGVIARLRNLYPDRRLTAECRPGNDASWRLLKTLGFVATGEPGKRPGRELLVLR